MNGVMGMAELLAKSGLDAKQRTFTDIILKSGSALLTIINDILDFSKIDAGQMELDPQPLRLAEAVEDVATLVSARVAEKDLELVVRIDPQLPEMFVGDAGRIRQIVTNLMGNAVKFTETGHVLVDIALAQPIGEGAQTARILFSVEDTGIGIAADKRDRIFDKFSQVDASATRKHEGTGLGLAIASSLVALMGGQMDVRSEPGVGSTFWFEIELPVHASGERRKRVPVDIAGKRVLVVDDNTVNRAILMEQMAAWRFDAATCGSAAEAIALLGAARDMGVAIDLAILDYHMPDMNGGKLARLMRADPATAGIPIIMLTSVDQMEDGKAFSALGVQAHLTKPARSSLLLETMISVLEHGPHEIEAVPVSAQVIAIATPEPIARTVCGQIDILVAEDNEVNRIVFTKILEMSPWRFAIAHDGREAVEMFAGLRPRMMLMDVSMPNLNGLEATSQIRALEASEGSPRTPIVAVTAHAIKGDVERCYAAGMDDYLSKPVSPDRLMQMIERWMDTLPAAATA
jgi:CheY-like chemotaxis protein